MWAFRPRHDPVRADKAETLRRVPSRCLARRVRALMDIDVSSTLRRCKQPILCISFRDDRVVPYTNVEDILREAPSAAHATVPGGHFTGYMNPELFAAEVEQFLARVQSA